MTRPAPPFAEIRNRRGERLDAAFHPAPGARVLAVVAHGITSNKDRPYLVGVADAVSGAGVAALRFSFAGHGGSEGRFENVTPSAEVEDLGCVLDAAAAAGFARIVCVGHSLGAAVGLLAAARDARIGAMVSLAGIVHLYSFTQRHFGQLQPGDPMLGRPGCPWTAAFAEDAARIGSLVPQASRLAIPWLLVHGTADELVPIGDALDARAAAGGRPELIALDGVDHRFTGAEGVVASTVASWVRGVAPRL